MVEVRTRKVGVVVVAAFDRSARSVRHLLEMLELFHHLDVEFISLLNRSTQEQSSATSLRFCWCITIQSGAGTVLALLPSRLSPFVPVRFDQGSPGG